MLKVQQTQQPALNIKNILSFRVDLHLKFTSNSVIWILNNTHSYAIRTIMHILRSFSRSKPSLTIAPEFGKTIEKPLISMVDLQKNIQWWWSGDGKTIENHWWQWCLGKENITIPSLWQNDHRRSLLDNQQPALLLYIVEQTETEYPGFNWLPARSCWGARSWWVPCQGNPSHHYTINREVGRGRPEEAQMRITRCQV